MELEKKKIMLNSFFSAQFNYFPLKWMLNSLTNDNKIKHLHKRCFYDYFIVTRNHLLKYF